MIRQAASRKEYPINDAPGACKVTPWEALEPLLPSYSPCFPLLALAHRPQFNFFILKFRSLENQFVSGITTLISSGRDISY